jgi:predicted deacetylase
VLIVAIHDVAPPELSEVRWLLGQLDAVGVTRRVLKVIPASPGSPDPGETVALLQREVAAGSEVVLHGWSHHAAGPLRGSLPDRLRGRLFAGGAAEFLSLDDAEVARWVGAGRAWLDERGLPAAGFCPPGWLATSALADALVANGFRYEVTLRGIRVLDQRRWIVLPPIGYMGAGSAQEALVRLGAAALSRPLRFLLARGIHRVFLHPQGASRSRDCATVLRHIAGLASTHPAATYGALVDA